MHVQGRDEFSIFIKYDIVSCGNMMISTTPPFIPKGHLLPHTFSYISFTIISNQNWTCIHNL